MGWFDNEQEEGMKPASTSQSAPSRPAASNSNNPGNSASSPNPASKSPSRDSSGSGSTLGPQIHIDGTIVCDEDLTILGRVDGTIRAKGTLVIANDADVHATIDGQRVVVHGKVDGDVHGDERVTIGQTGHLKGNIETPSLEIVEGAHFKGNVDMKKPSAGSTEKPAKPMAAKPSKSEEGSDKSATPKPSFPGSKPDDNKAPAQKQATT